ncbi:LPXTG cell wall anchor domain-containing protein [Acrocarpospora catenulata]|uniref:LPXTG cell wall anchor domain-containing protein n=1 Tax=Acrocarpospora catenulata TaxID=2836182 RepID=UPI001BD9F136|nr:LPXTG cell wall anchor domain-containing protein [Acrocarpospora catenulata]
MRTKRAVCTVLLAMIMALASAVLASAAWADVSATGPEGQRLTAAKAAIDPGGEQIRLTGTGYDLGKGIYVAVCVDRGAGQAAGPCVGGVDMEGSGGSSKWISSNPPAYGQGLATPYTDEGNGKGGFDITLSVVPKDDIGTDCTAAGVTCVIYTRADHTRSADRTQDVKIPVTWGAGGGSTPTSSPTPTPASTPTPTATVSATPGDKVETKIDAEVVAAPTPVVKAGTRDELPKTGVDVYLVAVVGLAVLAGGGIIVMISREIRFRPRP